MDSILVPRCTEVFFIDDIAVPYDDYRIHFKTGILHVAGDPVEGGAVHALFFRSGHLPFLGWPVGALIRGCSGCLRRYLSG